MYAGAATAPCRKRPPKGAGEVSPPCTLVIQRGPKGENYGCWEYESIIQSSTGRAAHLQELEMEEQWSKNRTVLWETLV